MTLLCRKLDEIFSPQKKIQFSKFILSWLAVSLYSSMLVGARPLLCENTVFDFTHYMDNIEMFSVCCIVT